MSEKVIKNNNGAINISVDSYNPIESALMQKLYAKYNFPIEGMITNTELYPELVKYLDDTYGINTYNFCNSIANQMHIIEAKNETFLMQVRSGVKNILIIDVFTSTIKMAETLFHICKKYEEPSSMINVKITSFMLSPNGNLEKSTMTKTNDDFKQLSHLYYPFLDVDEMFKQYLISNDSLLLLAAESGTGKTKVIDMLLNFSIQNSNLLELDKEDEDDEGDILVAYVKNPQILAMDMFWSQLNKMKYNFVICDDMDHLLIDRNKTTDNPALDDIKNRFISNFLSYTDGIFDNDTKFIITTNQSVDDIDEAILRKGRCFDVLRFRSLKRDEALDIWVEAKLSVEDFDENFPNITNITASELGAKIEMLLNLKELGDTIKKSYAKEEGISLHKKNFSKVISI